MHTYSTRGTPHERYTLALLVAPRRLPLDVPHTLSRIAPLVAPRSSHRSSHPLVAPRPLVSPLVVPLVASWSAPPWIACDPRGVCKEAPRGSRPVVGRLRGWRCCLCASRLRLLPQLLFRRWRRSLGAALRRRGLRRLLVSGRLTRAPLRAGLLGLPRLLPRLVLLHLRVRCKWPSAVRTPRSSAP